MLKLPFSDQNHGRSSSCKEKEGIHREWGGGKVRKELCCCEKSCEGNDFKKVKYFWFDDW